MSDSPTILDLSALDPDAANAELFGGKALGLARLCRAGAPTPRGFAISASKRPPEAWSTGIRRAFTEHCAALLEQGSVAVRSSGLGEDTAERSFAGLFETTLGVNDLTGALAAVASCIASGGSERVLQYAGAEQPLAVGVVVQCMVKARAAGVLFTRDPTGQDPALMIEAIPGTGDALMKGHTHPERWRVYRTGTGAVEMRRTPRPGGEGPVLTEEEARSLAITAWELAGQWRCDLDLEWAIDHNGVAFWLQARPITTETRWHPPVVSRSAPNADDGPITVWANWNLRETLPEPCTPLSWSVLRETLIPLLARDLFGVPESLPVFTHTFSLDLVDGRVYFNLNALLACPGVSAMLPELLRLVDEQAAVTTTRLIAEEVLLPRRLPNGRLWKVAARLRGFWRLSRCMLLRPQTALQAMATAGAQIAARPPVGELDDETLLRELRLLNSPAAGALQDGLALANCALGVWLLADTLFRPWPEARRMLAAGVVGNPTTQISVGIDNLIEAARPFAQHLTSTNGASDLLQMLRMHAEQDDRVKDWLARLDAFLSCSGHRAPQELELSVPRWVEDPSMILELVRAGLATPARENVAARLGRLRAEREAHVATALATAPVWKRPLLRWLAQVVQAYMPLREAPKHHAMQVFLRVRRAAQELGQHLVVRGLLSAPDDVFFFTLDELDTLLKAAPEPPLNDPREIVTRRRQELASFRMRRAPALVRSDGVPVEEPEDAVSPSPVGNGSLHGVGVGGGRGEGVVRVLHSPDPTRLKEGDVLVMEFADPGWTPLFPRAAAIVMEVGGTMCHAAVVARELGIPAVFGVKNATKLLTEGERVTVDGNEGVVHRFASPTPMEIPAEEVLSYKLQAPVPQETS